MRVTRPRLTVLCDCGELARLKEINAYPFTQGTTVAAYECSGCGNETKRTIQVEENVHVETT
jgi:hypothetical protein